MSLVLGIDGGGTKTMCSIARNGEVIGSAIGGASNLVRLSEDEVRASLHAAIEGACKAAGVAANEIEAACVGCAGAARENIAEAIGKIVAEVLKCRVEVVGDMEIAYDAAMRGRAGVIVIAGTGSIAYGRNERGETARAGGWGSIISDEGSGYWIGKRAVGSAFRAMDAGQSTTLIGSIMEKWQVFTREDLIKMANHHPAPKFSELAPAVFEAATQGDAIAQEILSEAGAELAKLAKTVMRRLWPGSHAIHVSALGGIFVNSAFVFKVFENSIRAERADAQVVLLTGAPVEGALFRAERLLASPNAAGERR